MNRRLFLRSLALGGGAGLGFMNIPLARAAPRSGHKFVFAYFEGGWDVLMGLDARDPGNLPAGIQLLWDSRQVEARYRTVTATPHLDADGRPVFAGPCMTEMIRHLDVSAILRGVVTDTVSHGTGTTYWSTGRFPLGEVPRGPSLSTLVAAQQGGMKLMPHLAIGGIETFNEALPSYAAALNVNRPSDFGVLLGAGRDDRYDANMRRLISGHQQWARECTVPGTDRTHLARSYRDAQRKVAETERSGVGDLLDLYSPAAPAEVIMVREAFGASRNDPNSAASYSALAYLALKNDLVDAISVRLVNNLDTHGSEWAYVQGPRQAGGFDALAKLVDHLRTTPNADGSGSMLDETTIIAASEFARTPLLNGAGGRDHWPCNAVMVIGGGARAGVYGRSDDNLLPVNVDPATGRAAATGGGIPLRPENICATVLARHGYDVFEFRAEPLAFLGA